MVWEDAVEGARAEMKVASCCQDASAGGLVKKSNRRREVVMAPVLPKKLTNPWALLPEPLL